MLRAKRTNRLRESAPFERGDALVFEKYGRENLEMAGKRPNQTDLAVGKRIRALRKMAGLSQTELGNQIGVTFQQVQKYENGTNRVGAGRLTMIACALDVQIIDLFDGLVQRVDKKRDDSARLIELRSLPAAQKLLKAFSEMSDVVIQSEIIKLVRALSCGG